MKITCKTLQQKQFQVDVDPSSTVSALKQSISKSQGFEVPLQKLIYSGKVLADDKVIADIGIKEKDFVVVMVSKPKAEPKPAAAPAAAPTASTSATTAPASTSAPAVASTTAVQPDASSTASAATPAAPASGDTADATTAPPAASSAPESAPAAAPAAPAPASADPGFLVGSHLQTTIDEIVNGMGFPRDQVVKAMRAAFNNPDRAVEYLMTGIPAGLGEAPPGPAGGGAPASAAPPATGAAAPAPAPAAPANPNAPRNLFEAAAQHAAAQRQGGAGAGAAAGGGTGAAGAAGGDLPPNLEALRNNPQIGQLRNLVQQNPALLQPFLQQLGASNPNLLRQLNANPQLLMQFLGAGSDDMGDFGDDDFLANLGGEGGAAGGGAPGGGQGGAPGGGQYVQVTEEERAAIDRLTAMGFERDMVIQAFFACDKNEEITANYLVEHGFDDYDDGDMQS